MSSSNCQRTLVFSEPLRDVQWVEVPLPGIPADEMEKRERAAAARGREESDAHYKAQIVEMREEVLALQKGLFQRMEDNFAALVQGVHERLPALVMAVSRRALAGLELDGEQVRAVIEEILRHDAPEGEKLTLTLCPADLEALRKADPGFEERHSRLAFEAEAELQSGDCLVRSRFGEVDARLSTKLRHIEQELST